MDRYDTNSKGTSPALSALLNKFATMPQSAFDETRQKSFDAMPYAIIPVECFLMFPNSRAYLRYSIDSFTKNPMIKRMLSNMTIELRTYKLKCSDAWEGWNNFITRGRSGKVNLQIPYIDFIHDSGKHTALPYNPYHYLNIAPATIYGKDQSVSKNYGVQDPTDTTNFKETGLQGSGFNIATSDTYKKGCSALPGVFYTKIAKQYQNSNLLQDNQYWYPENENHDLILPYNCTHAANASYEKPEITFGSSETIDGVTYTYDELEPTNNYKSLPWLNVLFFRQRKGNYFNTGSPFPDLLRGDIPTLDALGAELNSASLNFGDSVHTTYPYSDTLRAISVMHDAKELITGSTNAETTEYGNILIEALNKGKLADKSVKGIQFNMNQWRKLATMTVFRERMARTDGSYNQMIQAQFQHNPNWHEHDPIYCGGSSQPLVFSGVEQTGADGSTPLGYTAGNAYSSDSGNEIEVQADDFTMFMTVMTITPNDVYCQGISRMWSELTQSEQYFPILNNLEPQAIKNKELFLSGTDATDEDILNYQELFSHFKSRQDEVSGLMALPISNVGDVGAYLFNRLFNTTPQFNNAFVTGKFTSNENLCFASTEQAQFIMRVTSQMKYVAPMPAVTQPSDMGISY